MKVDDLKDYLGFAVAGNFAGHLGEAGEADEFAVIQTEEKDAPKGLFPFYIPNNETFLGTFPICTDEINHNEIEQLQVEAEVALLCDFEFKDGKLLDIIPKYFGAFNDCSNRVQDGNKLSTKKNWGKPVVGWRKKGCARSRFGWTKKESWLGESSWRKRGCWKGAMH